jgi:hypothetical protein
VESKIGKISGPKIVSFKGYTPKNHVSGRSYYKPVLFISSDELKTLVMKLSPVSRLAANPTQDRSQFIAALKALIRGYIPDLTQEAMDKICMNDITALAEGLHEPTAVTKSIAEISDPHKVSYAEYVSILKSFANKFRKIDQISKIDYKYVMEFNGAKYYWIPIEDLP